MRLAASHSNLEEFDSIHVKLYLDEAAFRFIDLLNVRGYLTKKGLLDPSLDNASILWVIVHVKVGSDDWCTDRT